MTDWTAPRMANEFHDRPRARLSAYLADRYPGFGRDKRLAMDIGTSPKAARNLFAGHWPGDETWAAIVRRFGKDVLAAVFEPEIDQVLARLTIEERQLEERLNEIRARRRQARGALEGHSGRGDAADEQDLEQPALPLERP